MLIGGGIIFFGAIVWYALRQAKQSGVKEQVARDQAVVTDAESQIHEVQAEQRDSTQTKKRLHDKSF